MRRRHRAALQLCPRVDVMFVLGSLSSANTRRLADLCRQAGVTTHHIESWSEFDPQMVEALYSALAGEQGQD